MGLTRSTFEEEKLNKVALLLMWPSLALGKFGAFATCLALKNIIKAE